MTVNLKFGSSLIMAFRRPPELLLRRALQARPLVAPMLAHSRAISTRAALITELGKPIQIEKNYELDTLSAGMVRISIHSCAVNYADVLMAKGLYQVKPPLPFVPGAEVAGIVEEVSAPSLLKRGQRVVALLNGGGFAEQCVVHESAVVAIPDEISFVDAVALPVSYGTAWVGLHHRAKLQPKKYCLVTAAGGAVGLAAVELASKVLGATVIAAAGSDEKLAAAQARGAHHMINYTTESIKDRVKEITQGHGADVIFEVVGGTVFEQSLKAIAFEGTLVVIGFVGGIPALKANILLLKNATVTGVYWGGYRDVGQESRVYDSIRDVLNLYAQRKISAAVHEKSLFHGLERVNDAFSYLESRKAIGKVVVKIK